MIKEVAKKIFKILKCEGYATIDFIVKEEEIYVLEINTIPRLTEKSLLPKAVKLMDIDFSDFLNDLIEYRINK